MTRQHVERSDPVELTDGNVEQWLDDLHTRGNCKCRQAAPNWSFVMEDDWEAAATSHDRRIEAYRLEILAWRASQGSL